MSRSIDKQWELMTLAVSQLPRLKNKTARSKLGRKKRPAPSWYHGNLNTDNHNCFDLLPHYISKSILLLANTNNFYLLLLSLHRISYRNSHSDCNVIRSSRGNGCFNVIHVHTIISLVDLFSEFEQDKNCCALNED